METPNPSSAAHRTKAYRLKKLVEKGEPIPSTDAEWFANYQEAIRRNAENKAESAFGSKSHKVSFSEESSDVASMGEAAAIAASSAMAREEGRRYDNLMDRSILAMEKGNEFMAKACVMFSKMTEHCLSQSKSMMDTHIQILDSLREHHIARTEAESELIAAGVGQEEEKQDIAGDLVKGILSGMGVPIPAEPGEGDKGPKQ